jgi:hypothetical protein
MANTFRLRTKANIGVTTIGIYTVPSATMTTIIGLTLANTSGGSINVGVGITRTGSDNVNIAKNIPIPQGSSLEVMQGNKIIMEATDTLTVVSDTNSSLDASLSILEMT